MPTPRQLVRMCRFDPTFLLVETFPNHIPWNTSTPSTANTCLEITEMGETLGEDYYFLKYNTQLNSSLLLAWRLSGAQREAEPAAGERPGEHRPALSGLSRFQARPAAMNQPDSPDIRLLPPSLFSYSWEGAHQPVTMFHLMLSKCLETTNKSTFTLHRVSQ